MSLAVAQPPSQSPFQSPGRRPGDTDRHRRQRTKNLFMFGFLLAIAVIFFLLTMVRLGGPPGASP